MSCPVQHLLTVASHAECNPSFVEVMGLGYFSPTHLKDEETARATLGIEEWCVEGSFVLAGGAVKLC